MPIRQQPRRTARILALLSLTQIRGDAEKLEQLDINDLLLGAIRSLTAEVENALETASGELNRSNDQVFKSETRTTNVGSAKEMLKDAIALTQKAINHLGNILELPEFIQVAQQGQVREYAIELITTINRRHSEINQMLDDVMIDWKLNRLSLVDSNILRIAVAEMAFLQIEPKVAINEAVEIAKTYSDDDGFRFINGVLRKISDKLIKGKL